MNHREKLLEIYQNLPEIEINQIQLPEEYKSYLAEIAKKSFSSKGAYTAIRFS
ncbi:hypothetical protein [Nostoc sp. LEGE 06077]|uniref:hypothetical protein n=1 Tax=Nostoc sp. LEGE 06077 TaxID=915325 RepID=UPI001D15A199|nr:hypothetical protein [Nostoc sp. LEGE 06077]